MQIMNKAKRITALLLSVLVIATGLAFSSSSIKVKAATNPVEFYSSYINYYYVSTYLTTYIKVNTLGSNQHVYLHENTIQTGWTDVEGQYVKTLSDGSQIWKVTSSYFGPNIEYAIKYQVDGQTYWDNNNGNNYTQNNILGSAVIGVNPAYPGVTDASAYPIKVAVKNLAYNKDIKVRYTQDNWATYTEQSLSYSSTNTDGSEYWTTALRLDSNKSSSFHYAVSYTVNGQTYWDNNFGNNYNYY